MDAIRNLVKLQYDLKRGKKLISETPKKSDFQLSSTENWC